MEKILIAYGIPAETISAIMMLYENTTSLYGHHLMVIQISLIIKTRVLQGDTLAPLFFIIILDYVSENLC